MGWDGDRGCVIGVLGDWRLGDEMRRLGWVGLDRRAFGLGHVCVAFGGAWVACASLALGICIVGIDSILRFTIFRMFE